MNNVYFLGPINSYSYILAKQVFDTSQYVLTPCANFEQIVRGVKKDGIGILPIENSSTSDIYENVDVLFQNDFYFIGEAYLKVNLHLIANEKAKLSDITDVYSHPKALNQCEIFIQKHSFKTHETESTAAAAEYAKENIHNALIGSKLLATAERLAILERNIGNVKNNMTRFAFVTQDKNIKISNKENKASVIFKVAHVPGALASVLDKIAKENINVTKIESRPIPGTEWEYSFWIDFEKENLSEEVINTIFQKVTNYHKILGIYNKGELYES